MTNEEILTRKFYASYRRVLLNSYGQLICGWEELLPKTKEHLLTAFTDVLVDLYCGNCGKPLTNIKSDATINS